MIVAGEYCDVNSNWEGICRPIPYFYEPIKLYPGDPCSPDDFKHTCAYGLQTYFDQFFYLK
jgi:hypothetical protein